MSRTVAAARRAWERRKNAAFPAGALTFHLDAWTRRRLTPETGGASAEVMARFGFDELLVVHGSALLGRDGVTLVAGPPGIGKSSVLRELDREGLGRFVEDGLLLVGARRDRWHLLVTGTHDVLDRSSRIGGRSRSLLGVRFCFYQNADTGVLRKRNPIRSALLAHLPSASFTLATAFGPRPDRPFTPACHEVGALVVLPHPKDPASAVRLRGRDRVEEVADIASLAPATVAVLSVSPLGPLLEVKGRLRMAILSTRVQETDGRLPD
ncbi:MAG TPA: hypothetical protein VE129_02650 [Thermoanaerobaculia bacterium]|nr:hypothetical protein [Thermoanaerobaculia bacterium]